MKIQTSLESGGFDKPHIPEGLYEAELTEVKDIADGQYGKRVLFIYKITSYKEQMELVHLAYVPAKATPDNKFGKVLIAHGVELGGEVDVDSLVGTRAKVMVEDYHYEDEVNGKKVDKIASSITKVKPLGQ